MEFTFLLEQVVNGLVLSGYYLLLALGLSLIFSVGGIVNLAHGAFYAIGAYVSLEIIKFGGLGLSIFITPLLVTLLGILFERFLLRRFYTADPILSLLVTFGLAMVTEQALRMIWGSAPHASNMPDEFKGNIILGDFMFSKYRLFILAIVFIVMCGIWQCWVSNYNPI
jgi:branched-chain amino acid transport system permease protein